MLPPVDFPTLGWTVGEWIEEYLCHGPGDVQGEPYRLTDERWLFLAWAYRLDPETGRRLVLEANLSRAKGWAKSEFAGAITCAEALGPVRFDGCDADGEPIGVPVTYPFIRCLATEEEQTGNTYDNVVYMLTEGRAADEYDFDIGRSPETSTRVILRGGQGGEIVASSSGDASKDGGKETFAVEDETHLYTSKRLKGMDRTVSRNTGKRKAAQPWILKTTTMYQPGERSVAEITFEKSGELSPEVGVTKHGVLIDHLQGPVPKRFNQDTSLAKAMRVAYGDEAGRMDFDSIIKICRRAEDPEQEAYRYFLNRARAGASQWLQPEQIKAVFGTVEPKAGEKITLGFDGSNNDDHTALWGCTESGDLFPIGVWVPDGDSLEWREDVDKAIEWVFNESGWKVERGYFDPPRWTDEIAKWARKFGRKKIAEFWTSVDAQMATATGATKTAIVQKTITIDPVPKFTDQIEINGRPIVQWHLENCRTRKVKIKLEDKAEEAYIVRKERPMSELKIDSAPSAILAYRARTDALKLGGFKKRKKQRVRAYK